MAKLTIGFAAALILLGLACFLATGAEHPTSLIPSGFGVLMFLSGILALNAKYRMHAMHAAVLVSLLGFIGAVVMVATKHPTGMKRLDMLGMAVLTGVFTVLCVRSFITARRNRLSEAAR